MLVVDFTPVSPVFVVGYFLIYLIVNVIMLHLLRSVGGVATPADAALMMQLGVVSKQSYL